jgi:hypothetical protein
MASYILVANKVESADDGYIPALEIVQRRLGAGRWPLFKNTPHQKDVEAGDQALVYLAGHGEQRFVAVSIIMGVEHARGYEADGLDALTNAPFQQLRLADTAWLSQPVPITSIKEQLDFVPKGTRKWGCVLQRGMKRISDRDAAVIIDHARGHSPR